jgi:hypothetical protein
LRKPQLIKSCRAEEEEEVVLIQLSSWGWVQSCSKHVEDFHKHITEEIVCQVGHLPELTL